VLEVMSLISAAGYRKVSLIASPPRTAAAAPVPAAAPSKPVANAAPAAKR
jgi:hypothetical protein